MNAGTVRVNANPPTRPVMPTWHIDWWETTVQATSGDAQKDAAWELRTGVAELMGADGRAEECWDAALGRHGYTRALVMRAWPGVTLQWGGTAEQGVHLSISGKPLAAMRQAIAKCDGCWPDLGALVALMNDLGHPWHASRLDVACDNEILSPAALVMQHATEGLVTRLGKMREQSERGRGGGTVYLGSRESAVMVRVYDKADEESHGDEHTRKAMAPWYRLEVVYKDERANRVLDAHAKHGHRGIMGEIDAVLSFRNKERDTNVTRAAPQDWWLALMKGKPAQERRPPKTQADAALDVQLAWASQHVGGLLARLYDERGAGAVKRWTDDTIAGAWEGYKLKRGRKAS